MIKCIRKFTNISRRHFVALYGWPQRRHTGSLCLVRTLSSLVALAGTSFPSSGRGSRDRESPFRAANLRGPIFFASTRLFFIPYKNICMYIWNIHKYNPREKKFQRTEDWKQMEGVFNHRRDYSPHTHNKHWEEDIPFKARALISLPDRFWNATGFKALL